MRLGGLELNTEALDVPSSFPFSVALTLPKISAGMGSSACEKLQLGVSKNKVFKRSANSGFLLVTAGVWISAC